LSGDAELIPLLRLQLTSRIGAVTYRKLANVFGSAEGALAAPRDRLLEVPGIGPETAAAIVESRSDSAERAAKEAERAEGLGIRLVPCTAPDYPRPLRSIYDPPLVLYVRGEYAPGDELAVGIVGARRCSYYGRSTAEILAGALCRSGFTVASGLARGIDSAAHRGALDAGGRTIAVLGNGLGAVYPPENEKLAEEIAASGAIFSEFAIDAKPDRGNFPRRNRIISALSLGIVVVEGNERSGALITARWAGEQGREVFAVPGKIDSPLARGPHRLIKDGAKLVESVDDILEELGPIADGLQTAEAVAEEGDASEGEGGAGDADLAGRLAERLTGAEREIYELLSTDPVSVDDLIYSSERPPAEVSSALMLLEIKRFCRQLPGKRFVRTNPTGLQDV